MRYYYTHDTLFVRGKFRAASTGVDGGIKNVTTLMNHTVSKDFNNDSPLEFIQNLLHKQGYGDDAFGLLTAVWMIDLCVLRYDYITVFVTAGLTNKNPDPDPIKPHTINIIVVSDEGFSDEALLETIMVVSEAKAHALHMMGFDFTGTTSDAVIAASSGKPVHTYAGTFTEPGKRIYNAVIKGVINAVLRHDKVIPCSRPAYFIYSRYDNTGWYEWNPDNCSYYPCHFKGQTCQFCYCPFYPCCDETLGEYVTSSSDGSKIWACSNCTLLHEKKTAKYLMANPDAELDEIKKASGRYD